MNVQPSCCLDVVVYMFWRLCGYAMAVLGHADMIFFQMAVLGHADMKFFSCGSSRPCRYEFFFQMAVLGHADDFFSNGSSRPCRYDFFSENKKKFI